MLILISIYAQPGAKKSEVVGWVADENGKPRLKVKIQSPPVEGAANEELLRFLKKLWKPLGLKRVHLIQGEKSREKTVQVELETEAHYEAFRKQIGL